MKPSNCPGPGYLQMDVKVVGRRLSGLRRTCYLYAAMDMWSRYKVGLILPNLDEEGALLALYHCTEQFPVALRFVQTDNGPEFQDRFRAKCAELGLEHLVLTGRAVSDNTPLVRSFRTDSEEFLYWLEYRPEDHTELNDWYQQFLHSYNTERPHQALGYSYPSRRILQDPRRP